MPFPKTRDELKAAGYKFEDTATCRGPRCRADIEFWRTPQDKLMPIDFMPNGDSPATPHWGTCKDREAFKK